MSGYTKLFGSILDSTVWLAPAHVRLVWITMLAMADRDGIVEASVPGLAVRARVTRAEADEALASFLAPDPDSRTPDHDGRRVEAVRGGWRLLNHGEYTRRLSIEDQREKAADRQREKRARDSVDVTPRHAPSRPVTPRHAPSRPVTPGHAPSRPVTPGHARSPDVRHSDSDSDVDSYSEDQDQDSMSRSAGADHRQGSAPEPVSSESRVSDPGPAPPRQLAIGGGNAKVMEVISHYRQHHPRALPKPTPKSPEWRAIVRRLEEGHSVLELCEAIDGCHMTPHNLGENERGTKYLGLELIMRTGDQVTRFAEVARNGLVVTRPTGRTITKAQSFAQEALLQIESDRVEAARLGVPATTRLPSHARPDAWITPSTSSALRSREDNR